MAWKGQAEFQPWNTVIGEILSCTSVNSAKRSLIPLQFLNCLSAFLGLSEILTWKAVSKDAFYL